MVEHEIESKQTMRQKGKRDTQEIISNETQLKVIKPRRQKRALDLKLWKKIKLQNTGGRAEGPC